MIHINFDINDTFFMSISNIISHTLILMSLCDEFVTYCQNFDFKIRRDHQINSYERRDYESVDEKSLSGAMSKKTKKKLMHAVKT